MVTDTPTIEEKLKSFNQIILKEATSSRDDVLNRLNSDTTNKLSESKDAIDREINSLYEKELSKATQEKDSLISKAKIEARKALMSARNEIVASILNELTDRLGIYSKSPEYKNYLMSNIKEAFSVVPAGNFTVYVTPDDFSTYQALIEQLSPNLTLLQGDPSMIGGCVLAAQMQGIFVDNSFKNKIANSVDELFKISILKISDR